MRNLLGTTKDKSTWIYNRTASSTSSTIKWANLACCWSRSCIQKGSYFACSTALKNWLTLELISALEDLLLSTLDYFAATLIDRSSSV